MVFLAQTKQTKGSNRHVMEYIGYCQKLANKPEPSIIVTLLDMLKFNAAGFFIVSQEMEALKNFVNSIPENEFHQYHWLENFKYTWTSIRKNCEDINLKFSLLLVEAIERTINEDPSQYIFTQEDVMHWINILHHRVSDELYSSAFFNLPDGKRELFEKSKNKFGQITLDRFPDLIYDIEESGKCLALGRTTATVFHLMRIMELAVQKFGGKLGVDLASEKYWHNILEQINAGVKKLPHGTSEEKEICSKYAACSAHLFNVKVAWRNEVMHPRAKYTEEEAQDIFNHVRVFIQYFVKEVLI